MGLYPQYDWPKGLAGSSLTLTTSTATHGAHTEDELADSLVGLGFIEWNARWDTYRKRIKRNIPRVFQL